MFVNVNRFAVRAAFAFVFFVDIAKGYLPVWLAIYGANHNWLPELAGDGAKLQWVPFAAALIALVGHSKSIFLKFKGGKSAATGLGTMLAMNFVGALCEEVIVLNFGRKIAGGTPERVREDKLVREAYLGTDAAEARHAS